MDIYPSGIKVPNEPQGGFGKPIANKGYTPGTFGVSFGKKPDPKETVSGTPNVGREVRNPETEELLRLGRLAKKEGFNFTVDASGNVTEVAIPEDWAGDADSLQKQLEAKEGETIILKKVIKLSGEFTSSEKEAELLKPKLKDLSIAATLETVSNEIKNLIDHALEQIQKGTPEKIKVDEVDKKLQEFHKVVERAKAEVAKLPTPVVVPEPQIENEKPIVAPPETGAPTTPENSPTESGKTEFIPKFFKVGQTFLLPKDHTSDEANWQVTILMQKEGAMMMKQIDGAQKGRAERFYFKPFKDFLERLYLERQQAAAKTAPEKPITETPKAPAEPEANKKSSILRPVTSSARIEKPRINSPEEELQKTRAQREVRAKFEEMFERDQNAFISLYTVAQKNETSGTTRYTENETLRKHPYQDVIRQIFLANNIELTGLSREDTAKKDDTQKEQEQLKRTALGSVYNPARDSAQAAGRMGIFSKPEEITSVGGMIQNSETILKQAAIENPLQETEQTIEKNLQEKLKRVESVLSTRIKNLSNNTNNLLKGRLSWIAFALVVGGAGALTASALTTGYLKNLEGKGPVLVSESLNKNEVAVKDTWAKYFHLGKTNPKYSKFPEELSKFSADQLKQILIKKYVPTYFNGGNEPVPLLVLGMFGNLIKDEATVGNVYNLSEKQRAEFRLLWDALDEASMILSGERLGPMTYEAAIEKVKEKVTNKEA